MVYWSTEPLEGIDFTAESDGVEYYELASRKAIGEECSYVMDNMAAGTYYVAVVGEDRQWVSSDAVFTSFTIESLAPNKPLDLTAEPLEKYPGTVSLKWKVPTLIFGKAIRSFEVY